METEPLRGTRTIAEMTSLSEKEAKEGLKALEKVKRKQEKENEQKNTAARVKADPNGTTGPVNVEMGNADVFKKLQLLTDNNLQAQNGGKQLKQKIKNLKTQHYEPLKPWQKAGIQIGRRLCLFLVLLVYTLIGGAIFYYLEVDNEKAQENEIEDRRKIYTKQLMAVTNGSREDIDNLLYKYELDLGVHASSYSWSFLTALYYSMTIYSTIGYGNIACDTTGGRIATVVYGVIGIPLMLAVLSDLGNIFLKGARTIRYGILVYVFRQGKDDPSRAPTIDPPAGEPPRIGTVVFVLFFITLYLLISSAIIMAFEDWDFGTAFYFFFVTFSTIGFGDVVPASPGVAVGASFLFLLGLALASIGISLSQQKLESRYEAAIKIMAKSADSEARQQQYERTEL